MGNIQEQVETWREARNSGVLQVVSSFFEDVGLRLVKNGEKPSDRREGDIVDWSVPTGIEVKGSSRNPFRLEWPQLQDHKSRAQEFPYDGHFWYMLFSYNSRESRSECRGRSRKSLTQQKVLAGEGAQFLAERVGDVWLVPVEALEMAQDSLGLSRGRLPCQKELKSLQLRRNHLRALTKDPQQLGKRWSAKRGEASVTHTVDGQEFKVGFRVSVIQNGAPAPQLQFVNWK